jgi:hypothetical protein
MLRLGREQRTVLIYYPGTESEIKNGTVAQVGGTREKAEAVARGWIDYSLKNQRKVHRAHHCKNISVSGPGPMIAAALQLAGFV